MAPHSSPANSAAARDLAFCAHPYTNLKTHLSTGPLVITRGEGVRVFDESGKAYIEGLAGLWCTALGFSEPRLIEAATRGLSRLPFYHSFGGKSPEPTIDLAERLIGLAPVPMSKVLFANSGSEANDTAIKLVWYYNNALGRPGEEEDHLAPARLPRRHRGVGEPDRAARQPSRLRPADRPHPAHRLPAPLALRRRGRERGGLRLPARRQPGAADRARRPGHHRRDVRRAGDGCRRGHRAAGDLLRQDPGGPRSATTSC